jgi:hypothetical protein
MRDSFYKKVRSKLLAIANSIELSESSLWRKLPSIHVVVVSLQVTSSFVQVESKFNEIERQRAPKTIVRTVRK